MKAEKTETISCSKESKEDVFVERETNKYKAKENTEGFIDKPDVELKTVTKDSGASDVSVQSEQLVTIIKNTDDGLIQAELEAENRDLPQITTVRDKVYDGTNFSENIKKNREQWLGLRIPIIDGVKVWQLDVNC